MFFGVELVKDRETKTPAAAEAQHVVYRCVLQLRLRFSVRSLSSWHSTEP